MRRLRALTLTLLPLEVDPDSINDPTSRVITPKVIAAYKAAAGDFTEAVRLHTRPARTLYLSEYSFLIVCSEPELNLFGMQITIMRITVKTSDEVRLPYASENASIN